jgi:hypothetical protein
LPKQNTHYFTPTALQGANPESLKWFREGELTNGRWAMAAAAGILFTDLVGLPKFWLAGAEVRGGVVLLPARHPKGRATQGLGNPRVGTGESSVSQKKGSGVGAGLDL